MYVSNNSNLWELVMSTTQPCGYRGLIEDNREKVGLRRAPQVIQTVLSRQICMPCYDKI